MEPAMPRFAPTVSGEEHRVSLFRRKPNDATVPADSGAELRRRDAGSNFLPVRGVRLGVESLFVRVVATGGIVGIGVALAAILGTQDVGAWIVGLVVSLVTVVLAAILWSSRTL
jgi:hypothetical protein